LATYQELKAQAAALLAEAERLRQLEIDGVIASIKEQIKTYGLTAHDLGLTTKQAVSGYSPTVKYRGPKGETWVGGRGRKPDWILAAIKAGKDIDKEFGV
jgi:DNA-binding protein H-NS